MKYAALVLAAGKGTRMHSNKPKVLQSILGDPMLAYVIRALRPIFGDNIWTVIGHQAEMVQRAFVGEGMRYVFQKEQKGTGHALMQAMPELVKNKVDYVLVINGDAPLISTETLQMFLDEVQKMRRPAVSFISMILPHANDYGRVVRSQGDVMSIVEAKDFAASLSGGGLAQIKDEFRDEFRGEVNAGVYLLHVPTMEILIPKLNNKNKSNEIYITDLVYLSVSLGHGACAYVCEDAKDTLHGVNNSQELLAAEKLLRTRFVDAAIDKGAFVHNEHMVVLGACVDVAQGAEIYGPIEVYGHSIIAAGAIVRSHCVLHNARIDEGAVILPFSHIENAYVGKYVSVGPYARLRPGSKLEDGCKIGNFVEIKKSIIKKGAKVSHLSYIGDASVGEGANVGAGTITCNYNGKIKSQTTIGAGAFIGSNTSLIAPVRVGDNALIGAGSVITKNVPEGALGITRAPQKNLPRKI